MPIVTLENERYDACNDQAKCSRRVNTQQWLVTPARHARGRELESGAGIAS